MSGNILGTYDLEKKVEDTLIVLDTTMRNYGDPNRAVLIESAILQLLQAKLSVDQTDRFALLIYGEKTQTILDFDDYSIEEFRNRLYDNIKILGNKAYLVDAVSAGFQVLAKSMMRLFEGKCFRMIIITEGTVDHHQGEVDWKELIDKSEKIGLYIDVLEVSKLNHQNILRSIASGTHGEYIKCSERDVEAYITSLAPKKKNVSINQSEADKNMKTFLEIIAQPLNRMNEKILDPKELLKLVSEEDEASKCAICHSNVCMVCKGPSYACGAYCPNCGRFFHEHCFAAWAENSKDTPPSIGKCPICFALLKVPGAMYRVKVLQSRLTGLFEPAEEKYQAHKIKARDLGKKGAQIECAYCRNAFDANEEIFECGNPLCNAYYHKNCFNEMIEHTQGRCRVCDTVQARRFDANPALQRIL